MFLFVGLWDCARWAVVVLVGLWVGLLLVWAVFGVLLWCLLSLGLFGWRFGGGCRIDVGALLMFVVICRFVSLLWWCCLLLVRLVLYLVGLGFVFVWWLLWFVFRLVVALVWLPGLGLVLGCGVWFEFGCFGAGVLTFA